MSRPGEPLVRAGDWGTWLVVLPACAIAAWPLWRTTLRAVDRLTA